MTDQPAVVTHEAVLDVRRRGLLGRIALAGELVVNSIVGDATALRGDVVVRSRTDGTEVLRLDTGFAEDPEVLLTMLRADLEVLPLTELLASWAPSGSAD